MNIELKPCPFCGSQAKIFITISDCINWKLITKGATYITTTGERVYAANVFAKNEEEAKKITYDLIAKKKWEEVETKE